jgi:hypothetical protein
MSSHAQQPNNALDTQWQCSEDYLTPEQRWGEVAEILATIALRSLKNTPDVPEENV